MCQQINPGTLQEAVFNQVVEFANQNVDFSAHDVTRTIREKVRNGLLDIPEVKIAGSSRSDIPHAKVKELLVGLWQDGNFDATLSLSRNFNGTYFVYSPSLNAVATVTPTVTTPGFPPAVLPVPLPAPPVNSTNKPSRNEIEDRINTYLVYCMSKSFRPTLKQIQSAIKRKNVSTGWTCKELSDVIEYSLGWTVILEDKLSTSQVAI